MWSNFTGAEINAQVNKKIAFSNSKAKTETN